MAGKGKKAGKGKQGKKAAHSEPLAAGRVVDELREIGTKLAAVAASPAGRQVIAAGLSMAAVAAQAAVSAERTKTVANDKAAKPAGGDTSSTGAKPGTAGAPDALAAMIGSVAETVLGKVFPTKRG